MNWRGAGVGLAVAVALAWVVPGGAEAALPKGGSGAQGGKGQQVTDTARRIDINQINMWVTNIGNFAWDVSTGNPGLIWPRGTDKTAIFDSGLWLGTTVGGETRVTVAEYSAEYGAGTMTGGLPDDSRAPDFIVYKVARYSGNAADTAHVARTADETGADPAADPLLHHSWSEYMAGAVPRGAPWRLHRLPVTATADPTDSVDVPGPDMLGDQMLWCVYNDADPENHTNGAGGTVPLGVEIQQATFGFNRPGALGNTVFLKFKIINKGGQQLDDMYVSLWSDPDLGGFTDDLVGVDVPRSLGYVYNATNDDQYYGKQPPAVGYDFFKGPVDTATGDTLFLASFNKYINGTDPASPEESYNYMRGLQADGTAQTDPKTGEITTFVYPGDPVLGTGWLDTSPADRRFMMSAGPFAMAPGDTQEVVAAIVVGPGKNRLSSISAMRFYDDFAQLAFDAGFNLPNAPSQPQVDVTVDHGKVTLCWDSASRLNYNQPGYTFEGYNVYQGASVSGPWTLLATYDEVNEVRVIYDKVFDFETGQIVPLYPVAFGSDAGVSFCHTVTEDAVKGGELKDGTAYYFAVTAYSYGPGEPDGVKVLENAQQAIRVLPQRPPSGTDPTTASATEVTYAQLDTSKPPATDEIIVEVTDPRQVTGHSYKVGFIELDPPFFGQVGQDTATVKSAWFLLDTTTGDTLLKNQVNKRGDLDYRVVDGLRVVVKGAYFPQLQTVSYVNANPDNRRALTGVNWSGNQDWFYGGAGPSWDFWYQTLDPGAMPDSFTTIEVRFDTLGAQEAYRYFRLERLSDGGGDRVWPYEGFHPVPFTVWDVVNNVQLEAAFVERAFTDDAGNLLPPGSQPATQDATWGPDASDDGAREYLFTFRRPYSGVEDPFFARDGALDDETLPGLYFLWPALRTADDIIDPGDNILFTWAVPAYSNDEYTFDTSQLVVGNAALAGSLLDRVRAVPNPYYNMSRYELNNFNRIIRFINLPEQCTVRIFNLAGDLVRTLEKVDPTTSILEWDVQNEAQLPVGSGIYLYHIEAPGVGSTRGKLAVFMEKERLNNF